MDDFKPIPPEAVPDMAQALAMLGAFGSGAVVHVGRLLDNRSDMLKRFERLDPVIAAATFGGLLTVPSLQANGVRVEALVHLSLATGQGRQKPSEKLVAEAFRYLGEGRCGRMEDPSEDMLVGAVRSPWGNFRVLEGLWEGGVFYLQRFIDVVDAMPEGSGYDAIRRAVIALLRLSEAACNSARLERFQLGAEMPAATLSKRALPALLLRRRHLRFSRQDLVALQVDPTDLKPFVFDMNARSALLDEPLGASSLERFPVLLDRDILHLVLPTAVSSAIRYFVLAALGRAGLTDAFKKALGQCYAELFAETPLLGGRMGASVSFSPASNGVFAETVTRVDVGRYMHFLFFTDALDDLDETGLAGINPASAMIGEEIDRRITRARGSVVDEPDFRDGITILVGCGIGRGVAIAFGEQEWPNWRVEFCSAYDLVTLSWTTDFKPTTLWRMLDARDRVASLGTTLFNVNGLINLVAWARSLDGHLVPHGDMPDDYADSGRSNMILVQQNSQRDLRHDSATTYDSRVERFIDGRWIRVRKDHQSIFADDQASPLYASEDPGASGRPMSAFLAAHRVWWADVTNPPGVTGTAAYERWRTVSTWLARAAPTLDDLPGISAGPVLWNAVFESGAAETRPLTAPLSYEQARAAIHVEVDQERRVVTTRAGEDYDRASFHPENIAERALVAALISGVAAMAARANPPDIELTLISRIVPNPQARHGHAFTMGGFRDRVRSDLCGRIVTINREDDAYTRLNLGWSVRDRGLGAQLIGKEACQPFLNSLVRRLEDEIVAALRRFDRRSMLDYLLYNHELGITDRDRWRRTSAAMIALHGDTPETRRTISRNEFKLNAVFQTTRILAEIAICECPLEGGARPGRLDLSPLMAKAALLFELGGWSDAMRWGMMKPELRITPLGDVHANYDFLEHIVLPHANVTSEGRIAEAVSSYAENLQDRHAEATVGHHIDPKFADAWQDQFGATIDQTRILIDFVENRGVEAGKAVLAIPRSQLRGIEAAGHSLNASIAEILIDRLVLGNRLSWRDIPEGFDDKDRQPWRYRRRLSLLRRPLLRIDSLDDPTILIAPGMVRDSFAYMLSNYFRGDFPDHQLSPKMKAWSARATGARGTAFATDVATALSAAGWRTRVEINIIELLGRRFDRDYGDVDVLAWRPDDGRVLAIECKDVQYRKTYGEIAEQLADFRGEVRANGRRDELRKHLDRMDAISAHLSAVSRLTGIAPLKNVESHLMFRHPVPMEFALMSIAEKVRVSRFDQIETL